MSNVILRFVVLGVLGFAQAGSADPYYLVTEDFHTGANTRYEVSTYGTTPSPYVVTHFEYASMHRVEQVFVLPGSDRTRGPWLIGLAHDGSKNDVVLVDRKGTVPLQAFAPTSHLVALGRYTTDSFLLIYDDFSVEVASTDGSRTPWLNGSWAVGKFAAKSKPRWGQRLGDYFFLATDDIVVKLDLRTSVILSKVSLKTATVDYVVTAGLATEKGVWVTGFTNQTGNTATLASGLAYVDLHAQTATPINLTPLANQQFRHLSLLTVDPTSHRLRFRCDADIAEAEPSGKLTVLPGAVASRDLLKKFLPAIPARYDFFHPETFKVPVGEKATAETKADLTVEYQQYVLQAYDRFRAQRPKLPAALKTTIPASVFHALLESDPEVRRWFDFPDRYAIEKRLFEQLWGKASGGGAGLPTYEEWLTEKLFADPEPGFLEFLKKYGIDRRSGTYLIQFSATDPEIPLADLGEQMWRIAKLWKDLDGCLKALMGS